MREGKIKERSKLLTVDGNQYGLVLQVEATGLGFKFHIDYLITV